MKNDRLIQEVKKLGYKEAEKNDLARASKVTVKSDRRCFKCNHLIKKGEEAITASHMTDKKYNVTLKELLLNDYVDTSHFEIVPVRHWICEDCATRVVNLSKAKKFVPRNRTKYMGDTALEEMYNQGEITAKEWDDIEMAEIHQYAFEEAVGIGQY